MSKQGYIARYFNIVRKLSQKRYCSYEELEDFLEREFEMLQLNDETLEFNFSKRTLQRDIREIRNILGIDIVYSRQQKGYYIVQDDYSSELFLKTIEEINSFSALKLTNSLASIVYLEKRKPKRSEFLPEIVQAIQKKRKIEFTYQKFGEDHSTIRQVSPLAIKEFKNRWYLIAEDGGTIKNFGLERMLRVETLTHRVESIQFNYDEKYQHCFGIVAPNADTPSKVIISVDQKQAAYLKSLPLHSSQTIVSETEEEVLIQLTVYITPDFVSELLSLGHFIHVIEPKELQQQLAESAAKITALYRNH